MDQLNAPYPYLPFFLTDTLYVLPEEEIIAEGPGLASHATEEDSSAAQSSQTSSTPAPSVPQEAAEKPTPEALPKLHTVGKNRRNIMLLVEDAQHPVMSRADGLFLKSVLQALKLDFDDVILLNAAQCTSPAHWQSAMQYSVKYIILFGLQSLPPKAPKDLPLYSPLKDTTHHWLRVDSLASIQQDVSRKKSLWNSLQQLLVEL